MYEKVDKPDNIDGKQKTNKVKFSPFVEVITSSNKAILIRKTTALWLLQEGERISSDRLFRVRCKQPYSHNLSDIQTSQKARPITIDDTPSSDVVVIDDNTNKDVSTHTQWLKIGGISLHDSDRKIVLMEGQWLWGTHLSVVQFLLKKQFSQIHGLEDTALVLREGNTIAPGSIQVLHVDGNHWLTISTIETITGSQYDVAVFDSLNFTVNYDTKVLIAKLLKTRKKKIAVKFANTNKQAGFDNCGVFAAAYCTALSHGQSPSSSVCIQPKYDERAPHKVLRRVRNATISSNERKKSWSP